MDAATVLLIVVVVAAAATELFVTNRPKQKFFEKEE